MDATAVGARLGPRSTRVRRFDPDRRDRLLQVALDVLVRHGAAGLTQRLVAAGADVPLGSVTYHFPSRDDLVRGAFERFVAEQDAAFERRIGSATTREELLLALTALVDEASARTRSGVLGFELHLAALRDPRLRELMSAWTAASRAVLARFMDASAAADLDAYLEGLILHALVAAQPLPAEVTRNSVERFFETNSGQDLTVDD